MDSEAINRLVVGLINEGRRRSLPSERIAAVRSAKQFDLDEVARKAGFADGAGGRNWDPGLLDILSYSSGYADGRKFAPKKGD